MGGGPDWAAAGSGAVTGAMAGAGLGVPGMIVGGAIGFLAPIIAGAIGQALSQGDRDKADALMQQAIAQFGPDVLKAPEIQQLTPHLGPSAFAGAESDPTARAAQQQALQRFGALSEPNNLQFRAATNAAEMTANQQAGAQEGAIRQQMQAHGMGGSGVDYALRQQAASNAANRSAAQGFDAAVAGQRDAREALGQFAGQANTMRSQSWDEAARKAAAADEINRFNEMGRTAGVQQDFQNRMGLAGARAGAFEAGAGYQQGKADRTQQQWNNYGQAAGQAGGSLAQFANNEDTNAKIKQFFDEEAKRRSAGGQL